MGSKKSSCRSLRGFTLIELLVVILTITVLLSILMPALTKAKSHSRLTSCRSNQHQILAGLHVYTASNEGKLPPHVSMNRNEDNVWWDFPNYLACHAPRPVGGSLGWLFADIIPKVDVWICPLSPLSPETELMGSDGVLRTYQELYENPDPVNHTWVLTTLVPLWRFGGFADKYLANNNPAFLGPGTEPAENISENARESDLAIMDLVVYDNNKDKWISSHPFKNSSISIWSIFHEGPEGALGIDITEEIGSAQYNSGSIDGHVESFNTSEIDPVGQYCCRGPRYFLPNNW